MDNVLDRLGAHLQSGRIVVLRVDATGQYVWCARQRPHDPDAPLAAVVDPLLAPFPLPREALPADHPLRLA